MRSLLLLALLFASTAASAQLLPQARLAWAKPTLTENGNPLIVGGYEIHYKEVGTDTVNRILITNPDRTTLDLDLDYAEYQFAIVAYDESGCYGQFNQPQVVTIRAQDKPQTVSLTVEQAQAPLLDPLEDCDDNCTVIED